MTESGRTEPRAIIERLVRAINAHDLESLVGCFALDVESVQPTHPARSFRGRDQVRQNWTQLFGSVPDLHAELLGCVVQPDGVWTEWRWSGTRRGGDHLEMRGVTIQRIQDDVIASLRFYMEPVQDGGGDVAGAIREMVAAR